jgi:hypothetical protein
LSAFQLVGFASVVLQLPSLLELKSEQAVVAEQRDDHRQ